VDVLPSNDRHFVDSVAATGDPQLLSTAYALIQLHGSGDPPLMQVVYRSRILTCQRDELHLLESAHDGDPLALAEATRRAAHLDGFTKAYSAWVGIRQ
jgi:hypothetical protein